MFKFISLCMINMFYNLQKWILIFISVTCFQLFRSSIFNVKACDSVIYDIQYESLRLCGILSSMWKHATLCFRRHEFDIVIFNIQYESLRLCGLWYSIWKLATLWSFNFNVKACDSVVFVDIILIFFVLWKTYWHCSLSCYVENLLTSYASWQTYWHRMFRGKFTDIVIFNIVRLIITIVTKNKK